MATKKPSKKDAEKAIASVFGGADSKAEPTPSKGKGKEKPQVVMGSDFEGYIALVLVEKALEGVKKQLDKKIKDGEAFDHFYRQIVESGEQPETFEGKCGRATAQFQFKRRSAGFSHEMSKELDELGVSYERTEKVAERYTINPKLLEDQALLGKLALAIKDLGADYEVIQKQEPVYSYQFSDATLSELSAVTNNQKRSEIVRQIGSIALAQAKIDGSDAKGGAIEAALEILLQKGILSV